MTSPAYSSYGTQAVTGGTTLTPAFPTTLNTGDLLICQIAVDNGTSSVLAITPPSGWVSIGAAYNNSSNLYTVQLFRHVYTSGDTAGAFTWTGSYAALAQIIRVTGASTTSPIGAVGSWTGGTATPCTSSAVTTTANNSLVILFAVDSSNIALTTPTGWSAGWNNYSYIDGLQNSGVTQSVATSGTSSGATSSAYGPDWFSIQVEILAAAAATDLSLTTTEGTDTAALSLVGYNAISLTTTEGTDTAALSLVEYNAISLATTEVTDTASITVSGIGLQLSTTEATDTASIIVSSISVALSIATTEATDTVSLAARAYTGMSLSTTEAIDTAAILLGVISSLSLATTEATDIASINVSNIGGVGLHLATIEATDTASISLGVISSLSLATTEATDIASINVTVGVHLSLATTEATDVVVMSLIPLSQQGLFFLLFP